MTPDQFTALAQLLRLRGGPAQEVARLALVEGLDFHDAATRAGYDISEPSQRRAAYAAVQRASDGLALARRAVDFSQD